MFTGNGLKVMVIMIKYKYSNIEVCTGL